MREADTGPKLLLQSYQKYGDKRIALRQKQFGIWQGYTWKDYYEHAKYFGLGLVSLGLEREDKVAIIGDNEPHWYFADLGVQSVGGIVIGIYTDAAAPEVKYIIGHSDSKYVVAKTRSRLTRC